MDKIRYSHFAMALAIAATIIVMLNPWPPGPNAGFAWTLLGLVLDMLGASSLAVGPIVSWAALRGGKLAPPAILAERVGSEELPDTIIGLTLLTLGFALQAIGLIRAS